MNFLAHYYLAYPTSASRAGNFLGDFITGTPASLEDKLPLDLVSGIVMHRHVDAFTDSHTAFRKGKLLLHPNQRRFAGIALDIFTDHFLARDWEQFSTQPLREFDHEVFAQLQEFWPFFSEEAKTMAKRLHEQEWFLAYRNKGGIQRVLKGLSQRRPRFGPITDTYTAFLEHYDQFEELSHILLRDAQKHFTA